MPSRFRAKLSIVVNLWKQELSISEIALLQPKGEEPLWVTKRTKSHLTTSGDLNSRRNLQRLGPKLCTILWIIKGELQYPRRIQKVSGTHRIQAGRWSWKMIKRRNTSTTGSNKIVEDLLSAPRKEFLYLRSRRSLERSSKLRKFLTPRHKKQKIILKWTKKRKKLNPNLNLNLTMGLSSGMFHSSK